MWCEVQARDACLKLYMRFKSSKNRSPIPVCVT